MKQIPLLFFMLLVLTTCRNQNPNLNRKELLTQLDELNQQQIQTLAEIPDGYVAPPGIKYTPEYENSSKLIRLDILKALQNPVDYPLSKAGRQIEYRKIDVDKYASLEQLIPIEEGYIYRDMYGLGLLNHSLQQEQRLLKQDIELMNVGGMQVYRQKEDIRSVFYQLSTRSLKCFARYEDPENEREYKFYVGDLLLDDLLSSGGTPGMEKIINRIQVGDAAAMWPIQEGMVMFKRWEDGLYTLSEKGDTLCYFLPGDPEPLNLKGTVRGADHSNIYRFEDRLSFRLAYTDTVFRVTGSHTFEPIYKIDLGSYKVSRKDGLSVSVSLAEKYIVHHFFETRDQLFIRVSKNYDCPNTRNSKTIFFYQFVYDKKSNNLVCFKNSADMHTPGVLKNDLDRGPDFWPAFLFEGNPACKLSVKDITDPEQRKWLQQQTGDDELDEDDIVLMIVK